ncbi:MAG: DsbA family protein [bacterium]|nr:DsbA family protein [bacterium]
MPKEYFLPASILVAGVLIAGAVIYSTGLKNLDGAAEVSNNLNPNPQLAVSLELTGEDVILGSAAAPVTIVEYGDFQCPFCGKFFSETESQIKENYVKSGKVKFVYRHFAFLGPESLAAAEAAECAKDQGKFWQYHDALYSAEVKDGQEHNGNLNESFFKSLASQLGMNLTFFSSCLADHKYADKVQKDYDGGRANGVQATPTTFVNGTKLEGAVPYNQFKAMIDQLLIGK